MLLTVFTTVYNSLDTIDRCVRSVLEQLPDDCEYVLVDDGSTDGTGEHLEKQYAVDLRVRIIHQQNEGSAGAFNTALINARGDYIFNLDDDDYLFPNTLVKMIDRLQQYHPDMVQLWYRPYRPGENFRDPVVFDSEIYLPTRKIMLAKDSLFRRRFSIISTSWNVKAIRRSLVSDLRATGPGKGADSLFIRQALLRANSFLVYPLPIIALFEDPHSVSRSKDSDDYASQNLERWLNAIGFFEREGRKDEWPLLGADQIFYAYRDFCAHQIARKSFDKREAKKVSKLIRLKKRMIMPRPKKKRTWILNWLWLYAPNMAFSIVSKKGIAREN